MLSRVLYIIAPSKKILKKTKAKVKKPGKPAVKAVVKPSTAAVAKSRPHEGLLKSIGGTVGKMFGPEASTLGAEAGDLLGRFSGGEITRWYHPSTIRYRPILSWASPRRWHHRYP